MRCASIVVESPLWGRLVDFFCLLNFSRIIHYSVWLELRFISQKKKTRPLRD